MEQEAANQFTIVLLLLLAVLAAVGGAAWRYWPKRKKPATVVIQTPVAGSTTTVTPSSATVGGSSSSGTATVVRQAFFLEGSSFVTLVKWLLRFVAIAAVVFIVMSVVFRYDPSWIRSYLPSTATHWFMIVGLLVLAAIFLPKGTGKTTAAVALALVLLMILGTRYSPFINWSVETLDRGINYGDWSDPSGYVPRVDGGTFRVPAGSIRTVDISGRVKIPIPVHHCLDIKGKFFITWDDAISNAFITPKSGGVERGTIEALPAERCGNEV